MYIYIYIYIKKQDRSSRPKQFGAPDGSGQAPVRALRAGPTINIIIIIIIISSSSSSRSCCIIMMCSSSSSSRRRRRSSSSSSSSNININIDINISPIIFSVLETRLRGFSVGGRAQRRQLSEEGRKGPALCQRRVRRGLRASRSRLVGQAASWLRRTRARRR